VYGGVELGFGFVQGEGWWCGVGWSGFCALGVDVVRERVEERAVGGDEVC